MKHGKRWLSFAAMVTVLAMMMSLCPLSAMAATQGFEENNCLKFATKPGETSGHVSFYKDGYRQSADAMTWVEDPTRGTVLSLDGQTEYMQIGFSQLRMPKMTFATWINYRGSLDPANPAGGYWQRLLTIHSNDNQCYFTVSPHAMEPSYVAEDGGPLDGVVMEYYRGYTADEGQEALMRSFTGARTGESHFGLPQNEWHHMAVVVGDMTVTLYIDGNVVLEEVFIMPIVQMYASYMKVGSGIWDDPNLNALLDDTLMFDVALSAEQIAAVMQTGDPASIHDAAAVTTPTSFYHPTTVTEVTAMPSPTEVPEDKPFAPFGLPVWGFGVVMALLAVVVILTVILNMYESNRRRMYAPEVPEEAPVDKKRTKDITEENVDADDEPKLSIKQAALKKRQEERERFLAEEQAEKEKGEADE